jgi:DNA-binding MarR family transcriptional regulator
MTRKQMSLQEEIQQEQFESSYHKAVLNILFTSNQINRSMGHLLKHYGLSIQQYNVLRILRGVSPQAYRLKDIQKRMLDKSSNATRLVEKLRSKGYLTRTTSQESRRQVDISITESGLSLLSAINPEISAFQSQFSELGSEKAENLSALLDEFRNRIHS